MKVPITKAVFDQREFDLIQKPLQSGWVVQGPFVKEFEEKFGAHVGAPHAIACTSCTTGLHLALAALGVGPGDEVIVPAYTWIATANAVEYQGASVVFCDIDLDTFNLDIKQLENKVSDRTKAIVPVHLFGLPAEMKPIMELAEKNQLYVVEDAACGFGSYYRGDHVGTIGHFGAFSFHPRKSITTGEGGMVTTRDNRRAGQVRSLRDHGASKSDLARHNSKAAFLLSEFKHLGFNYRMTDLQGALGVAQMEKAEKVLQQRRERAGRYRELLSGVSWLELPHEPEHVKHSYQSFVCMFQPEEPSLDNVEKLHHARNQMMLDLEAKGVSTRQGTHAVHALEYYQKKYRIQQSDFANAWLADRLTVALPLYPQMTDEEQDYVVSELKNYRF